MTEHETRIKNILQAIREKDFGAGLDVSARKAWLQDRMVELVREFAKQGRETGEPAGKLTAQWEKELPDEDFWKGICARVEGELQPYRKTAFLREKTEEEQAVLLQKLFDQGIRYQEQRPWLMQELDLTDEQVLILLKTYNTMIRWVVAQRLSPRYFRVRCQEAFGFSETLADRLWELLDQNRAILAERFVYQVMLEQRQQMKELREAVLDFLSFADDIDLDEDEEE